MGDERSVGRGKNDGRDQMLAYSGGAGEKRACSYRQNRRYEGGVFNFRRERHGKGGEEKVPHAKNA